MIVIVSTISLVGIALWLQVIVRIRAELGFLTASSSVILVLYLAALAGWLAPAAVLLYVVGVGLGAVALARFYRSPPENCAAILVSIVAFIVLSIIAWLWLHGRVYHDWDEFSHWGRVGKTLSVSGALPTASTGVMFKDYPPAAALLHYFIVFSQFSEGGTYFAQALLLISTVLALVRWTGPAGAPLYFLVITLGLILIDVLGLGYATVGTDHLVGAVFGAVLAALALGDPLDRRSSLALVPVLFCLPLIKPIGIVTATCAAGVIVLEVLRINVLTRRDGGMGRPSRSSLAWVVICVILVAMPYAAHRSWRLHVEAHRFRTTFNVRLSAGQLRTVVTPSRRTPTQELIVTNFRGAFRQASLGRYGNGVTDGAGVWLGGRSPLPPRSARHWLLCLTSLSLIAFFLLPRNSRATHAFVHTALAVGCIGYLAVLLYVYLYSFGTWEATRVTSFGRYAGTWFLAWALVVISSLGQASRGRRVQYATSALILVPSIAWGVQCAPYEAPAARHMAADRQRIVAGAVTVQGTIPPLSPTYVVWQDSTGFPFYLIAYELSPRVTNRWCWSVGEKYYADDIWTCPLSVAEFSRSLDPFEYLLVAKADDRFWAAYQALFEGSASAANRSAVLFKIRHGAAPMLRRVDTQEALSRQTPPGALEKQRREAE